MLKPGITERWAFRDRFRWRRALAGAHVILLDDSFPPLNWVHLSKDVRIIQLWHASGAFKTVGYSRAGKPGDLNPFAGPQELHRRDRQLGVRRAVLRRGVRDPGGAHGPTGIPRMDRFFDEAARAGRGGGARGLPGERRPVHDPVRTDLRGGRPGRDFGFERLDYAALHAVCVERDAVVIIKMHPFVHNR